MNKNKLAIIGIFFDGYSDLWNDFIKCFKKNWKNCPYECYIVNNIASVEFGIKNGIHVINAGSDAEYSRKVQIALDSIDAEYYLLMLEDFFFGEKLKSNVLETTIDYIFEHKIKYYSLSSLSSFSKYKSCNYDDKYNYILKINPRLRYTLGCQAVIWQKDFLRECIGKDNYNAWIFEGALAKSRKVHTKEFLLNCVKDTRNILCLKHGVLQRKLIPSTVNYFERLGEPLESGRSVMTMKDYRKYIMRSKISSKVPTILHKSFKNVLKRKRNAVLNKYNQEIDVIVKKNFQY